MRHPLGPALCALTIALASTCAPIWLLGCASGRSTVVAKSTEDAAAFAPASYREERALLLLMEDRRTLDAAVVEHFASGAAPLREMLAVALGRIGDAATRPTLEVLLVDADAAVRRAAAFGLGEMGDRASTKALLRAVADSDPETGGLAVEALSKIGASATEVNDALAAIAPLPTPERWGRLLPYLFRFKGTDVVVLAVEGLKTLDPTMHAQAAYALAREPQEGGAPWLRLLLADSDPSVRDWAARGLGAVGEAGDLARLRPLLDDANAGVVIQTLRSAKRLIGAGKIAAPREWTPRLRALFDDPRPGVAVTALEAAGAWLLDETLGGVLAERAGSETVSQRHREVALLALADGKDPRAGGLADRVARAASPVLRARAAEAAGKLGLDDVLTRLLADQEAGVRAAALDARLQRKDEAAWNAARAALVDPDPIVRSTAIEGLGAQLPLAEITRGLAASAGDRLDDAQLSLMRALGARAKAEKVEPAERAGCLATLQQAASTHDDFLVRRQAADILHDLGEARPAIGAASDRQLDWYRAALARIDGSREVDLATPRGTVRIRLACQEAPLTCLNFLQLAGQGYFDGLTFHRVVPDFVAQAGDPRGDGSGGPGFTIRDELNRLRYRRGAVGMALSGPDTGGSQFFLTLTAQPHLDGGYTIFGDVVSGMDVADRLEQGDKILHATIVGGLR
ncbi:MAG: peptidylprolyl isomerase [Acidobacteriota bacterium]